MMDKHMSQLPPFLSATAGLTPVLDCPGDGRGAGEREQGPVASAQRGQSATSANQEDHVSMAPAAGRRLWEMAANTRGVLAVEWLAACQALICVKV